MARSDYESLTRDELLEVVVRQEARIAQLEARIKRLEDLLERATRGGKRQAAPSSKGLPKSNPKKPGRKSGADHGSHAHGPPPPTPFLFKNSVPRIPVQKPLSDAERTGAAGWGKVAAAGR